MNPIKIFMDTEFTGLHKNTTLISIGMVADNGKFFYAEFNDYDNSQIDGWLQEHVIGNLLLQTDNEEDYFSWSNKEKEVLLTGNKTKISQYMQDWMQGMLGGPISWVKSEKFIPEIDKELITIVTDCGSYDWVLFTDLFGTAFDLPRYITKAPEDLFSHLIAMGYSPKDAWDINREVVADLPNNRKRIDKIEKLCSKKHNALWDAYILMLGYSVITMGKGVNK